MLLRLIVMGLSTAERNRRRRERKKRDRKERRSDAGVSENSLDSIVNSGDRVARERDGGSKQEDNSVEIVYVVEPSLLPPEPSSLLPEGLPQGLGRPSDEIESVLRRFHQRASVASAVVSDEEKPDKFSSLSDHNVDKTMSSDEEDDDNEKKPMSKRKLRELIRPTVAELKRRVKRPDLVEAHDITAADPDFLIMLKSIPGTVPVPRHWGRKRKYLQGKRGFEKPPFQVCCLLVSSLFCSFFSA